MKELSNRMSSVIEWINVVAICMLAVTLIFPSQYQIPFFYIYAATTALDVFYNKRWQGVKPLERCRLLFIPMILFYLCIWIWHPFEESNMPIFKYTAENRLPFLIFGLMGFFTTATRRFHVVDRYYRHPLDIVCRH